MSGAKKTLEQLISRCMADNNKIQNERFKKECKQCLKKLNKLFFLNCNGLMVLAASHAVFTVDAMIHAM